MTATTTAVQSGIRHILLATDGSEFSEGANRLAIAISRRFGAKLTAMTMVLFSEELEVVGTRNLRAGLEEEANATLAALADLASRDGVNCELLIRFGEDPHREIVGAAQDVGADLIVIGRRGKRGLARVMLGDATAKVIGGAHCHVLVAPRSAQMWQRRIVLATDGSAFADAATAAVAGIAANGSVPVTIVSAIRDSFSDARAREADAAVARAKDALAKVGVAADTVVDRGQPDEVIVRAATETGAELIVTGTHGRTGLGRIVLGSVTERVINSAQCAVLAVKPSR
jgi:nucleotide-binding universal stress UspA family protein